jgi:HSP20 family protein
MHRKYDSIEKIRFIHGLMKKEVEELIKFISSDKLSLSETGTPPMDVMISDKYVRVFVELAGLSTKDFTVYQYDDLLIIEGVRPKLNIQNMQFVRVERDSARFKRVLRLPFNINDLDIRAKLKDGVLDIYICRETAGCDF